MGERKVELEYSRPGPHRVSRFFPASPQGRGGRRHQADDRINACGFAFDLRLSLHNNLSRFPTPLISLSHHPPFPIRPIHSTTTEPRLHPYPPYPISQNRRHPLVTPQYEEHHDSPQPGSIGSIWHWISAIHDDQGFRRLRSRKKFTAHRSTPITRGQEAIFRRSCGSRTYDSSPSSACGQGETVHSVRANPSRSSEFGRVFQIQGTANVVQCSERPVLNRTNCIYPRFFLLRAPSRIP